MATRKPKPRAVNDAAVFYRAVRKVPRGRVSTYGAIALIAGKPRAARQVGVALAALRDPDSDIPWQRVLASKSGRYAVITPRGRGFAARQRQLLESEGVRFDTRGRVDLLEFGFPIRRAPATTSANSRRPGKKQSR